MESEKHFKKRFEKMLWKHFIQISKISRASGKEQAIRSYIIDIVKDHNLSYVVDQTGNLIVKSCRNNSKDKKPIILQAHLDMIQDSEPCLNFDFDRMLINLFRERDWVRAKGTSLGADNGIGLCAILAVLTLGNEVILPIEALFTVGEEKGMTGVKNLEIKLLSGEILVNLDAEDDNAIIIGCAGGIGTKANANLAVFETRPEMLVFEIIVQGLEGGHSGLDMNKESRNAILELMHVLSYIKEHAFIHLIEVKGGELSNSIPKNAYARFTAESSARSNIEQILEDYKNHIICQIGNNVILTYSDSWDNQSMISKVDTSKIIECVKAIPNGIILQSQKVEGAIETSSNIGLISLDNGNFEIHTMQRSHSDQDNQKLSSRIKNIFRSYGFESDSYGKYPGWSPRKFSPLLEKVKRIFVEQRGIKPKIFICHAGLECGYLASHFPNMDMISIGPNIRHIHTVNESVSISSVRDFLAVLLYILKDS